MTLPDIERYCRLVKEIGHTSRVDLPVNVVMTLVAEVKAYRRLPQIAKDAAREMAR